MKQLFFCVLGATTILAACKKDGLQLPDTTAVADLSYIRVHYYSPSPNGNFFLKFDSSKVGNTFFYSQTNPSDGAAYLAVPAGTGTVRFVLPKSGGIADSIVMNSFAYDLPKGRYQSVFVLDTGSNTRALIVPDTLDLPAPGTSKVRFVNAMYNVPAADVAIAGGTRLVSNLAFGTASAYVQVPAGELQNIRFYNPGTTTQLTGTNASSFLLNLTPGDRRIYTVVLRGVAANSATAPVVTTITNR